MRRYHARRVIGRSGDTEIYDLPHIPEEGYRATVIRQTTKRGRWPAVVVATHYPTRTGDRWHPGKVNMTSMSGHTTTPPQDDWWRDLRKHKQAGNPRLLVITPDIDLLYHHSPPHQLQAWLSTRSTRQGTTHNIHHPSGGPLGIKLDITVINASKWRGYIMPSPDHDTLTSEVMQCLAWIQRHDLGPPRASLTSMIRADFQRRWLVPHIVGEGKIGYQGQGFDLHRLQGPKRDEDWQLAVDGYRTPAIMIPPRETRHYEELYDVDIAACYPHIMTGRLPSIPYRYLTSPTVDDLDEMAWMGRGWIARLRSGKVVCTPERDQVTATDQPVYATIYHMGSPLAKWAQWTIDTLRPDPQDTRFDPSTGEIVPAGRGKAASVTLHTRLGMRSTTWRRTTDPVDVASARYHALHGYADGIDTHPVSGHGEHYDVVLIRDGDHAGETWRTDVGGWQACQAPQIAAWVLSEGRARLRALMGRIEDGGGRIVAAHTDGCWCLHPPESITALEGTTPEAGGLKVTRHEDVTVTPERQRWVAGELDIAPGIPRDARDDGSVTRLWSRWTEPMRLVVRHHQQPTLPS